MTGHPNSLHPSDVIRCKVEAKANGAFCKQHTLSKNTLFISKNINGVLAITDTSRLKDTWTALWRKYSVYSIHSICCDANNVVTNSTFTGANSATIIFCLWYFFADRVYTNNANNKIRRFANTLASDILLGLAIFTKIPIFSNLSKRL